MAVTPRIFVSATTGDLKSHRATVAAALRKLESHAVVQDDWPPDYRTVEQMIRRRIKDSDAVIHLVGLRYGAEPSGLPPGVPRRSYTQMEYYIARELKKPVYVFLLPDTFPYDSYAAEEDDERRALQAAHRLRVAADHHLHYSPQDHPALEKEILSLQPLVEKLRLAVRRQRVFHAAVISALFLVSTGIAWAVLREKGINEDQAKAITELQLDEPLEVRFFKKIQHLRRQSPHVVIAQAGGGSDPAGQMSYADALVAVAKDHGLTAGALRGMLDNFATRVIADPNADPRERSMAEFHRGNFAAASSIAGGAADKIDKDVREKIQELIELRTLEGDAEEAKPRYNEALAAYQKALAAGDKNSEPLEWTDLATNVAQMHYAVANHQAAEPLFREILRLREKHSGKDNLETAHALNNLSRLLDDTNRFAEAEPLKQRTLAIMEGSLGKDHPHVALGLNNFATTLIATNRLAEAEPLLRRAVAIWEKAPGKDQPGCAATLQNLAHLLKATNRLEEAEPMMRRALAIFKISSGNEHPNVARSLNNLAQLLRAMNRKAEAEPLLRQALEIGEKTLGENHPSVATALNNLALVLASTERKAEAEPLMRRALAIDESASGNDHPDVARDLYNLARLLQDTSRPAEAEPHMRRALEIYTSFTVSSGHPHPNLEAVTKNYRRLLLKMGGTEEEAQGKIDRIMDPILKK